ncbi:hypothetical protein [Kocuria sp. CPCC 205263]
MDLSQEGTETTAVLDPAEAAEDADVAEAGMDVASAVPAEYTIEHS